MNIPNDRKYRESHEWALVDGDLVTVGISDFAQDQLGDVVFVELPEVGRKVAQGDSVAVVESVKTASDIYAPVGGEVTEVNQELLQEPERINADPYGQGWILRLRADRAAAAAELLDADAYRRVAEEQG